MSRVCTNCQAAAKPDAKPGDPCWRCGTSSGKAPLELETGWAPEKAAKQELATKADTKAPPPSGRRKLIAAIVSLLIVAAGVVGVAVFLKAAEDKVPEHPKVLPGGADTVSIEIRARPQMNVRVDQNRVGKTPLTIHIPKKGQLLMIEATAPGHDPQFKQVTADHDQTVDFTE